MQVMKWGLKPHSRKLIACMVALIMFFSISGLGNPGTAGAKTETSDPATSLVVSILNPDSTVDQAKNLLADTGRSRIQYR